MGRSVIIDGDPSSWSSILHQAGDIQLLELGTGCGIVGIFLASSLANSSCLLTDLPDAMELLDRNWRMSQPAKGTRLSSAVLDWAEPLPAVVAGRSWDVIVVSDCTYNFDTVPDLVKTMTALGLNSPMAIFIISMKVRHESEAIFFELIAAHQFSVLEHRSVPTSHQTSQR